MQNFSLVRPSGIAAAIAAASQPGSTFIAGGTDLMQLWENNVEQASQVIDLEALPLHDISVGPEGLRLGALAMRA